MTVYLGDHGFVELKRTSGAPIRATLDAEGVNTDKRRFSFEGDVQQELITGDRIEIRRVSDTNENLELVAGENDRDWGGYAHIDIIGGVRLYKTFEESIRGNLSEAVELVKPSEDQRLEIETANERYRCLARIQQFEFTTERETIDTTILGDNFRKRYEAGLISGQGRLDCFWDHKNELCDPDGVYDSGAELPIYLAQLCIRLVQGADFLGRFFIYAASESDDPRASENSVWYEAECVVTNVSITVSPTQIIQTSIDFVTTGQIRLLVGVAPSYLLKEDTDRLLLEDGSGIFLAGTETD